MSSSASSTAAQPSPRPTTTPPSLPTPPTPRPPSPPSARHTTEARTALVASLSNLLDAELAPRATALHSASSALAKQERDLARATGALAAETGKLGREAEVAGKNVKMLGNVQNWAEVLEREFLVLEETVRIVKEGECDSGCCSCEEASDNGSVDGERAEEGERGRKVDLDDMASKLGSLGFGTGDTTLNGSLNESGEASGNENGREGKKDKGKAPEYPRETQAAFSDTSRSLGTDSPGGTDQIRESETTSFSTT